MSRKELICSYGPYKKNFKLSLVSNQEGTKDEFFYYQQALVKCGKKMIDKTYVARKSKHLAALKN